MTAQRPGARMYAEIQEQPAVLERLRGEEGATIRRLVARFRRRPPALVVFVARGSSDNAALFGRYAWETLLTVPVSLAAPSVVTLYRTRLRLQDAWVVALSQSGQSPDVVAFTEMARRIGAFTVGVTNEEGSPLARAVHEVVRLHAGPERSVVATKTYLAQLFVLSWIAAEACGDKGLQEAHGRLVEKVAEALGCEGEASELAARWRGIRACVVTARGYQYATAREAALKLKEACAVAAEALSSADFLHGPVALVTEGFPVLLIASPGAAHRHLLEVGRRLRRRGADCAVLSSEPDLLRMGAAGIRLPGGVSEVLGPHISAVAVQLLAYHLARLRGLDPDRPPGLRKVTRVL